MKFYLKKIALFLLLGFLVSTLACAQNKVSPQTALKNYIDTKDKSYQWV